MARSDEELQTRIEELEEEERRLRHDEAEAGEAAAADRVAEDAARLAAIRAELVELWDLLRQRRGLRDAGRDPEDAEPRDADTVEGYLG